MLRGNEGARADKPLYSLHSFEYIYSRKLRRNSQSASAGLDFNITISAGLEAPKPAAASPRSRTYSANAIQGSYPSTPASPNSMAFSNSSSPSSTALEFPQTSRSCLLNAPQAARVKPSKHFISFDGLRRDSRAVDDADLEAQDKNVGRQMKELGW